MSSKATNSKMLDLAYEKGVKNPQFCSFFNGFPREFFLFLREGRKSRDILTRTKALKVSAELIEQLDDQVEHLAQKSGAEKGIVFSILLHSMERGEQFSKVRDFCKENKLVFGDQILDNFLSMPVERKKPGMGVKKMHSKGKRI